MPEADELLEMKSEAGKTSNHENEDEVRQTKRSDKREKVDVLRESLIRIETNLEELTEKRRKDKPKVREHFPNTYNSLSSYGNTHTVDFVVFGPSKPRKEKYLTKNTAISMCDPWESHKMDTVIEEKRVYLPPGKDNVHVKEEQAHRDAQKYNRTHHRHASKDNEVKPDQHSQGNEATTEETVKMDEQSGMKEDGNKSLPESENKKEKDKSKESKSSLRKRSLYFDEVPRIRQELREKHSMHANSKVEEDYNKTREDYYHKKLDRMEAMHPKTRPIVKQSYFAYLQNTPGSKRAVKECIKETEEKLKKTVRSRSCSSSSGRHSSCGGHPKGDDKVKQPFKESTQKKAAAATQRDTKKYTSSKETESTGGQPESGRRESHASNQSDKVNDTEKSFLEKLHSPAKKKSQQKEVKIKFQYQRKYAGQEKSKVSQTHDKVNKSEVPAKAEK